MSMAIAETLPGEVDVQPTFVHLWDLADEVQTSAVRLSEIVRDGLITATRAPGVARQGAGRRRGRAPYIVAEDEADRVRRAHHRAVELSVGLATVLRWQRDGLDATPVDASVDAAVERFAAERDIPLPDDWKTECAALLDEHGDELMESAQERLSHEELSSIVGLLVLGLLAVWLAQREDRDGGDSQDRPMTGAG